MESTQTQSIAKCSLKSRQIFWLWKTENSGRRPHKLLQRVQQTQHVVFGNVFPLIGFMSDDRDLKRVDRIENVVRQIALKDCFDAARSRQNIGADRETPPQPFSSDFTRQYGLRSASNAQRAADSLVAKDLIERQTSSFVINDRFLRMWISQLHS